MLSIINFLDFKFDFWVFLLPFGRVYGALIMFPLFAGSSLLNILRFSIALLLALLVYPYLPATHLPENYIFKIILFAKEIMYGALLGWLMSLPIYLIESSGNVIDIIRGEQISSLINPITKNHSASLAKLLNQGFITYFIVNYGLLWFLGNLIKSFDFIAISQVFPQKIITINYILNIFINFFSWVVLLALPAIGLMFLLEISLGIISSFIPQLNVTVISMPLKSAGAMIILIFYLPSMYHLDINKFLPQVNFQ